MENVEWMRKKVFLNSSCLEMSLFYGVHFLATKLNTSHGNHKVNNLHFFFMFPYDVPCEITRYYSCVSHMVVVSFLVVDVKHNCEQNKTGQKTFQHSSTLFSTLSNDWQRASMSCNSPGNGHCFALKIRREILFLILFSHPQVQTV